MPFAVLFTKRMSLPAPMARPGPPAPLGRLHVGLWREWGAGGCTWHPRESPFPAGARGYPGSVSGGCLSDSRVPDPLQQVVQPQGPIQLWGPWLTGPSGQCIALEAALSPWPGACMSDVSICQSGCQLLSWSRANPSVALSQQGFLQKLW